MQKKHVHDNAAAHKKNSAYLEVYICEDGTLTCMPLTNNTLPLFKELTGKSDVGSSEYCG